MDASVNWKQRLSMTGSAGSGFEVALGANPSVGGDADGFRPLELMLVSLVGCAAMDVISILQKKRQDVSGYTVAAHAEQTDEHPHVFTSIEVEHVVTGRNISPQAVERAIELSVTKYCPAQAMLGQVVPIKHKYQIQEAAGG